MSGDSMRVHPEQLRETGRCCRRYGERSFETFWQTRQELDRDLEQALYRYRSCMETVWSIQQAREQLRRVEGLVRQLRDGCEGLAQGLQRAAEEYEALAVRERELIEQLQVSVAQWLGMMRLGASGGMEAVRPARTGSGSRAGEAAWEWLFSRLKRGMETAISWWEQGGDRWKEGIRVRLEEVEEAAQRAEVRLSEEVKEQLEALRRWAEAKFGGKSEEAEGAGFGDGRAEEEATSALEEAVKSVRAKATVGLDAAQLAMGFATEGAEVAAAIHDAYGPYDPMDSIALAATGKVIEGFNWGLYVLRTGNVRPEGRACTRADLEAWRAMGGVTVEEAAAIARHVYYEDKEKAKKDILPGGWKLWDDYKKKGLKIGIYERRKADGTVEYVLANTGTDEPGDWDDNVKQPVGGSEDVWNSMEYVEDFIKRNPKASITFVGHSKGGAEAAANAVKTNKNAILFNPARPSLEAYGLDMAGYKGKMTAFVVEGELLHEVEKWLPMPYEVVYVPGPGSDKAAEESGKEKRPLEKKLISYMSHDMAVVEQAVQACKAEDEER